MDATHDNLEETKAAAGAQHGDGSAGVVVHVPQGAVCELRLHEADPIDLVGYLEVLVAAGRGAPPMPAEGDGVDVGELEIDDEVWATVDGIRLDGGELAELVGAGLLQVMRSAAGL